MALSIRSSHDNTPGARVDPAHQPRSGIGAC